MPDESAFKIVILTGLDSGPAISTFSRLAQLPGVQVLGVLLECEHPSVARRLRNLRRNIRREGLRYVRARLADFVTAFLEKLAARVVSRHEVSALLRQSFPERVFSIDELGARFSVPVHRVANLNRPEAADWLRALGADLGIVYGTRILKRSTFAATRLGCLNVHKGKVPEYRGMPPGFWELWEGQETAGVTIHVVDDGLDTGQIVGEDTVAVHPYDSVETLQKKLDVLAEHLLARCVLDYAGGRESRRAQPLTRHKPRTSPTRAQRRELEARRGLVVERQAFPIYVLKTLFNLSIYFSGLFHLIRAIRRWRGTPRVCVLLYHRVNDLVEDSLTTGVERFAEHIVTIGKHYSAVDTATVVSAARRDIVPPHNAVAIHFDDCYRDVFLNASSILAHARVPGTVFVSSGFVGTDRRFAHDAACPVRLENLTPEDIQGLLDRNCDIGAHTVTHEDLGRCTEGTAWTEVTQSRDELEALTGLAVRWMSFPFGRVDNTRPVVREMARTGYEAMFAAYGGFVKPGDDCFDLPRMGMSGQYRPLDLLMEIEGVSVTAIQSWLTRGYDRLGALLGVSRPRRTQSLSKPEVQVSGTATSGR